MARIGEDEGGRGEAGRRTKKEEANKNLARDPFCKEEGEKEEAFRKYRRRGRTAASFRKGVLKGALCGARRLRWKARACRGWPMDFPDGKSLAERRSRTCSDCVVMRVGLRSRTRGERREVVVSN